MPYRSPRGIQYEDVAQAADALLQEGARPTIERIRLRLGRGSPNTVSPMLERWFGGLGQRLLGSAPSTQDDTVPAAVTQAAQALWSSACAAAEGSAAQAWSARQATQDAAAQELEAARTQLQAREALLHERVQAMESALALSTQQLSESNERGKAQQTRLEQHEQEVRDLRSAALRSSERLAALQQQLEQAQEQARSERQAIEARHGANERRWLEEVDRARQETRKSALALQEQTRKSALLQTQAEAAAAALQTAQSTHAEQLQAAHQALASAQAQAQASQHQALLAERQAMAALVRAAPGKPLRPGARHASNTMALPAVRRTLGKKRL